MYTQKSYEEQVGKGTLYIVPTPIGNLEDITIRALNTLKTVDLIAAEDTRNTKKLLSHFDIHQPLISYHEHSDDKKILQLIETLKSGKDIALVSDAGMPAISDPGTVLVQAAIEEKLNVVVLPGANAALCALVGSGLSTETFYFYGFLPRKNKERELAFAELKRYESTLILYESPHRLKATLVDIEQHLGGRYVTLARELTKRFEEYIRGPIDEVIRWSEAGTIKGEFCIIIEGGCQENIGETLWWNDLSINEHVNHYIEQEQLASKLAIKQVANDRKLSKRDVYQSYHVDEKK